jgi:TolA-binding protein
VVRYRGSAGASPSLLLIGVLALYGAGCANEAATRKNLNVAYAAAANSQYDEAISRADDQLARTPAGAGSSEALYLRGRTLELRVKKTEDDARNDFTAARQAYIEALQAKPTPDLEPLIRAGLANVAYWQDDYPTAIQEWTTAYGKLSNNDADPFILYRIGLSQQRLGQFDLADKTFAAVQQRYPMTEAADRARGHTGFRSFAVQLATFASSQSADAAVTDLRRQGVTPTRLIDPRGRHVIGVGSLPNYAAALQVKSRFASKYPDAVIVP